MWSPTPTRPSSPTAPPLSTDFTTQPQPSSSPFRVNPGMTRERIQQLKKFTLLECNMDWRKHGVNGALESVRHFSDSRVLSFQMQVNFPETRENCHALLDFTGNIKTERCQNVPCALVGCKVWKTNWKVKSGSVQTTMEEFENGDFFLRFCRLGLPSTFIRKGSLNRRNLKKPAFLYRVDGKHFENGPFSTTITSDNHVIFLTAF